VRAAQEQDWGPVWPPVDDVDPVDFMDIESTPRDVYFVHLVHAVHSNPHARPVPAVRRNQVFALAHARNLAIAFHGQPGTVTPSSAVVRVGP
jgi:hypothetical protein